MFLRYLSLTFLKGKAGGWGLVGQLLKRWDRGKEKDWYCEKFKLWLVRGERRLLLEGESSIIAKVGNEE